MNPDKLKESQQPGDRLEPAKESLSVEQDDGPIEVQLGQGTIHFHSREEAERWKLGQLAVNPLEKRDDAGKS